MIEISKELQEFVKKAKIFRLINRKYIWETIQLNFEYRNKNNLENFIINKLNSSLKYLNCNINPSNPQMPVLLLLLKGRAF